MLQVSYPTFGPPAARPSCGASARPSVMGTVPPVRPAAQTGAERRNKTAIRVEDGTGTHGHVFHTRKLDLEGPNLLCSTQKTKRPGGTMTYPTWLSHVTLPQSRNQQIRATCGSEQTCFDLLGCEKDITHDHSHVFPRSNATRSSSWTSKKRIFPPFPTSGRWHAHFPSVVLPPPGSPSGSKKWADHFGWITWFV